MNFRYPAIIIALLFVCQVHGQSGKMSAKLGSEYAIPNRSDDLGFFGSEKDGLINLYVKNKSVGVIRFDPANLSNAKTAENENTVTSNYTDEGVLQFGNRYLWLHSDWDKSASKEKLYYDDLDVKTGKLTTTNNLLLTDEKMEGIVVEPDRFTWWFEYKVDAKYRYNQSADLSKLMISYQIKPESKNEKKFAYEFGFLVLDNTLKEQWKAHFTMPYLAKYVGVADYAVDATGNAYMLTIIYNNDQSPVKQERGYHYELFKITPDGKSTSIQIPFDNYYARALSIQEDVNHNIVVTGTYGIRIDRFNNEIRDVQGIFNCRVNQSGEVLPQKTYYFPVISQEIAKYSRRGSDALDRGKELSIYWGNLRETNSLPDGSVLITLEDAHLMQSTSSSSTTNYYTYESIYVMKIGADGVMQWFRKIPKNQKGRNRSASLGYMSRATENGIYFIFLDHPDNEGFMVDENPKQFYDQDHGNLVGVKIDLAGKMTSQVLLNTKEEGLKIKPRQFAPVSGNLIVGRCAIKGPGAYKPLVITLK